MFRAYRGLVCNSLGAQKGSKILHPNVRPTKCLKLIHAQRLIHSKALDSEPEGLTLFASLKTVWAPFICKPCGMCGTLKGP